jgi:hypothetical protein
MKRFFVLVLTLGLMFPGLAQGQYVMDLGSLITAIRIGDFSGDLDNLDRANTVYVTRVSSIAGVRLQGGRLDSVVAQRGRVLDYLRHIIGMNRAAMRALEIHNESLADVIFITTTNDGTAMLYVDDR